MAKEVRTHDLLAGKQKNSSTNPGSNPGPIIEVTKCINGVEIKWRFGRISKKNASQIMIFLPHYVDGK